MRIKTFKYFFFQIDPTTQLSKDSKVKRIDVYVNPSFMQYMYKLKEFIQACQFYFKFFTMIYAQINCLQIFAGN